jgi:hypothetical protein
MKAITDWFTPERRQQIQVLFGALAPLFILGGFGTEGQWEQILIITGAVLQFLSSLLSLVNVRGGDAWAVLRGAIYALATTVAPALVLLGWLNPETSATLLTGIALGLTALSSLVAIFTSGQQQIERIKNDE